MATKQPNDESKTSKTARVMNLLSKKQEPAAPAAEPAAAAPAPAAAPILSSATADAAVSTQIRDALEGALQEELAPAASRRAAALQPAQVTAPVSAPAPVAEPAPAAPAPAPVQDTAPRSDCGYINVMQVLVEEKAPKYVKMIGCCDCPRCMEDIKALALNHLPPKYVVLGEHERVPKLTFYEGKYNSDITAQLLQACQIVGRTPHHDRNT